MGVSEGEGRLSIDGNGFCEGHWKRRENKNNV